MLSAISEFENVISDKNLAFNLLDSAFRMFLFLSSKIGELFLYIKCMKSTLLISVLTYNFSNETN